MARSRRSRISLPWRETFIDGAGREILRLLAETQPALDQRLLHLDINVVNNESPAEAFMEILLALEGGTKLRVRLEGITARAGYTSCDFTAHTIVVADAAASMEVSGRVIHDARGIRALVVPDEPPPLAA
jgi:hypothetical protein